MDFHFNGNDFSTFIFGIHAYHGPVKLLRSAPQSLKDRFNIICNIHNGYDTCIVTIRNLKYDDSGIYSVAYYTMDRGKFIEETSVTLDVKGNINMLQIIILLERDMCVNHEKCNKEA